MPDTRQSTSKRDEAPDDEMSAPMPIGAILGLARLAEYALDEVGLTIAQYRLLGFCSIEPTTPSEVAKWLSIRKQSVTRQLDWLVNAGLLERQSDPGDRRRAVHTVTQDGQRVLDRGELLVHQYLTLVLAMLDEPAREVVHEGLHTAGVALHRAWALGTPTAILPGDETR
jgi:DNA-binding MarR family transcriptional regulator